MAEKTKYEKEQIVVVGGGFGGIKAALELSKNHEFQVTLISNKPDFRYNPTLYHTATGGLFKQSSIPLSEIFEGSPVRLIEGEVITLDKTTDSVELKDGTVVGFDKLILALGVVTNYFGIKGLEEYSYGIKSMEEVRAFRDHIHQQIEDDKKPDLNYIIAGAGPSGVELAGVLPEYIRHIMDHHGVRRKKVTVTLVEAAPRVLPRSHPSISKSVEKRLKKLGVTLKLGKGIEGASADGLMLDGKLLPSHTIVWTAGTSNHPFFVANGFTLNERGKVQVDDHLIAARNIYVIGDNAGTKFSGLAQTALHDGMYVAHDIEAAYHGNIGVKYAPKTPGSVVPVGPGWSAFELGPIRFTGPFGWFAREMGDWIGYHDIEPWWKASVQWATEFGEEEVCPTCNHKNKS